MASISIEEYINIKNSRKTLTIEEKESLFTSYQQGDNSSMHTLVESYYPNVIDYVLKLHTKRHNFDIDDMIKYINSCLFKRMQICTSIFSYEKDIRRLIEREAARYLKRIRIINKKEQFDFINLEIDANILKVLKDSLEPDIYYIFYQMVSGVSIEEISTKINLDLLSIRKRYIYALEVLETFLEHDEKRLKRRLYSIKERESTKSDRIKIIPYSIDSIIIYFYLKDSLTNEEQKLYYYQIFSKYEYTKEELCQKLKVSQEELESIGNTLNQKINETAIKEDYISYREKMLNLYGQYIYNLVKSENYKKFDYRSIKEVVGLLSFDDIKKFLDDDCAYITPNEKKLLYKYYYRVGRYTAEVEDIERDVNLNLFGYKVSREADHPKKYYQTYLAHIYEFDESQRLFLECYYFKIKDKKEFVEKYPNSPLYYRYYMLTNRLEKLYYNVNNFTDNAFTKAKWLSIRDRYKERNPEERVFLLDLFYGVQTESMSITEIHKKYYPELTYVKIHDIISDAREAAINMYINKKHKIDITNEDYIPFLADKYDYTDETRQILTLFLKENKPYKEISSITGLNTTRISNIITDGIRKIDHYRLGVLDFKDIDTTVLDKIYELYGEFLSKDERRIYAERYVNHHSNDAIAKILGIPKKDVNSAFSHLYSFYDKYLIKDISISLEDIKEELDRHFRDTVLTPLEIEVLSTYYKVKTGPEYDQSEPDSVLIPRLLNITKNKYYHAYYSGIDKIKLRKRGHLKPDLVVIPRDELTEILKDSHLPISDKERYIINSLLALNNYPYQTMDELATTLGDLPSSIRRRYYRAIVNIKKYLLGELDEQINYEEDIVPNLKYFSNSDRVFIYDYYKEHLSYEKLAKKYHLTPDMVLAILNRIKIYMYELTHGKLDKIFDFDYYKEAIEDPDLPFYGDLNMARQIFELYFGMNEMRRLSIPEIRERLGTDLQVTALNNAIYQIMIAVSKLKEGIKKTKEFTYEEILSYYNRHVSEMDSIHKVYYERYFKRVNANKELNGRKTKIPEMISYDLLKEQEPNLFHLNTATKEEIQSILNNPNYNLDSKTKYTLLNTIHPGEELGGREINHIYRIINSLLERNLLFVDKGKSYRLKLEEQ